MVRSALIPGHEVDAVTFVSERVTRGKRRGRDELLSSEIEGDLERIHSRLRQSFGYKRRELTVDLSESGAGRIVSPDFEYTVRVEGGGEDPDGVRWFREVRLFRKDSQLSDERLSSVFGDIVDTMLVRFAEAIDVPRLVDRLEESETPGIRLDYDLRCQWCELEPQGAPVTVRFEGREMRVAPLAGTALSLGELLHSLSSARMEL